MRLLLAAALAAAAAISAANSEPLTIRIGWNVTPGNMAAIAWEEPKTVGMRHAGLSYVAEPTRFQGGGTQLQAIAAGRLDIALTAPAVVVPAVRNAGLNAKIIADVIQDPCNGTAATITYYVLKSTSTTGITDLKGKSAAVSSIGSAMEMALSLMQRKAGMQLADIARVEAPMSAFPALLTESKVATVPLAATDFAGNDLGERVRRVFTQCDAAGPMQMLIHFTTAEFIAAHRPELVDMMEDLMRATRWFEDPKNRDEALRIAAKASRTPRAKLEAWLFTPSDFVHDPDLRPDLEGLQHAVDAAAALGVIKEGLTLDPDYLDLSLIADAKRRLDGG